MIILNILHLHLVMAYKKILRIVATLLALAV